MYIEQPQEFHTPKGHAALHSGAVGSLLQTVGYYGGYLEASGLVVGYIPVWKWKGNARKQITTVRTNRRYGLNLQWKGKDNNAADAIGMGHWYLHKQNPPATKG